MATVTANFGQGDIPYDGNVVDDVANPPEGVLGIKFPGNDAVAANFGEIVWGKVTYQGGVGSMALTGERVTVGDGFDTCTWTFKTL